MLYCGKFSWGPIFAEGQSSKFSRFNFHGRECLCPLYTLYNYCAYFVDLISAVSRLSAGKNREIGPLEIPCYTVVIGAESKGSTMFTNEYVLDSHNKQYLLSKNVNHS
jgi:hypothetical protein